MKKVRYMRPIVKAIFTLLIAGLFIVTGSATFIMGPQKNIGPLMTGRGSTIYVDDDNIAGPWEGSLEHPFRFIQDGVDAAVGNDTVFVFEGTYFENVVITVSLTLTGERTEGTLIDGKGFGTVLNIFAEGVTVTGFTITHCGSNSNNAGILIHTPYNIISENNIQYNYYFGIRVMEVNNTIYHNNFVKNSYQAFDEVASSAWDHGYPYGGNYWSDYTGTDENDDGIGEIPVPTGNSSSDRYPLVHPYGSVMNEETQMVFLTIQAAIADNATVSGHHIRVQPGAYYEQLSIDKALTVSGPSYNTAFLNHKWNGTVVTIASDSVALSGFTISGSGNGTRDAGILLDASDCHIRDVMVYNNYQGILLASAAMDNEITRTIINQNRWNGLVFEAGCRGNQVFENNIINNNYAGVAITQTTGNYLYHNNFKNNRYNAYDDGTNVWDDGLPSGGNYWDDYEGVDENKDGIGDTPYLILNGFNKDRYPLMDVYSGQDSIAPLVIITSPSNGLYLGNLRLLSWLLQKPLIIGAINVDVEASDAQSGIDRVEFILDDASSPSYIDNIEPYSWPWKQPSLLFHKHTVTAIAYDKAGNYNYDIIDVERYL
jgi:parallel beta-helix repeat protein